MNPSVSELDLLLLAVDALDPDRAAQLRLRMARDPKLQRRFAELRQGAGPGSTAARPPRWRIPPPGMALAPRLERAARLAPAEVDPVRVGDSFFIRFDTPPTPATTGVVLLTRQDGDWSVVSPAAPSRTRSVADLARVEGRHCRLELVAHPPAGPQRWAVALPPMPVTAGDRSDPWAPLRTAIAEGTVPVGTVDIQVTEAGHGGAPPRPRHR